MIQISLAASGNIQLTFPSHSIELPFTEKGLECLHSVLSRAKLDDQTRAKVLPPTQWDIDQILLAMSGDGGLQLAGDEKRWEDIERRTGVKVRRFNSKGFSKDVTLEELLA